MALAGTLLPLLLPTSAIQAPALFLCAALVGVGASTGYANTVSLFGHYAPMQGSVMGLFSGVSSIGCMVMPMLMASLARHTSAGYQSIMWVLCTAYCAQLLLLGVVVLTGQRYLHRLVVLAAEEEPLLVDALEDGVGSGTGGGGGGNPE
jgi:MFS family permease